MHTCMHTYTMYTYSTYFISSIYTYLTHLRLFRWVVSASRDVQTLMIYIYIYIYMHICMHTYAIYTYSTYCISSIYTYLTHLRLFRWAASA